MGDFFAMLRKRVDANARRAVEIYTREVPEYRALAADSMARAALLDLAVTLRRDAIARAEWEEPFSAAELGYMEAAGRERGERGISLTAYRHVLTLNAVLTLREIQEAADPDDLDRLMRTIGWLAPQGMAAQDAFTRGYMAGKERHLPFATRVQSLARLLLADDPTAPELARTLDMGLPERYVVTVVRLAGRPFEPTDRLRDEVVEFLLENERVPVAWPTGGEFVALVPVATDVPDAEEAALDRALCLAHAFAEAVGRPCSAGTASGPTGSLEKTAELARQVSRAAPIEPVPSRLRTLADVFVELGTAQVSEVDHWLRDVARRLTDGPDLVTTLDAYYRCDMNRQRAAGVLHIHPRTLDYRLQRTRELTGVDPGSTHGIRVLNTAVARILAGAWPDF
ncbi:helix-turn-helix domain-containing protein [Spongiactinospora sp. TRM90649]|uniref:PucR family transcriptional regulator n=1 Tax=Spongiactinospora sp. TRM90649 TaxID=3031114 RepID=UPI0023F7C84B|nr:helix-turn-helix domain-containing protein [Spongiactinospora sp. TRM90649]MDF5758313.1 helix-turn-helix domain-containing protein [Spongiactinospora sp. TRM90649]